MNRKINVIFVSPRNVARSHMAKGWLNHLAGDRFQAECAGTEAGTADPLAVEAMREVGVDISDHDSKRPTDFFNKGHVFGYAISVHDPSTAEETRPIYPGRGCKRLDWNVPASELPEGATAAARLERMRAVRDTVRDQVTAWLATNP